MASAAALGRAGLAKTRRDRRMRKRRPRLPRNVADGLEGHVDRGHLAEVRPYRPLGPRTTGREDAQRP